LVAVWLLTLAWAAPAEANTWRSPDAWGSLTASGSQHAGNQGFAEHRWNSTLERYEIRFSDSAYSSDDVTVVSIAGTAACPAEAMPRVSNRAGELLVMITDVSGERIQCPFRFVTYFTERNPVQAAPLDNERPHAAPIAMGAIDRDGDTYPGVWGVDAVEWNAALGCYEIDITG
jgi:hypothetical protein